MNQHDALLAAVCAAPDDDLPRLVYADWCDENNDPDRAEFIRTQIEIEKGAKGKKLAELQERETELLGLHTDAWTVSLKKFSKYSFTYTHNLCFRRGFVEDFGTHGSMLLECGDELFRLAPIRRLYMHDIDSYKEFAACPHLLRIMSLDIGFASLSEASGVQQLFLSPYLVNLSTLVARGGIAPDLLDWIGLRSITRSKSLANLRELDIGGNPLSNDRHDPDRVAMLQAILELGLLNWLTELGLSGMELVSQDVQALAGQPWLGQLKVLDLRRNLAGDDGGRALATSPHLENIERLDLRFNTELVGTRILSIGPRSMSKDVKQLLKHRFGERVLLDSDRPPLNL